MSIEIPSQGHSSRVSEGDPAGEELVEEKFKEWWQPIVMPDGEWDLEQVKRELYDYARMIQDVSEVYDHITRGAISKPDTLPEVVIAVADDVLSDIFVAERNETLSAVADGDPVELLTTLLPLSEEEARKLERE